MTCVSYNLLPPILSRSGKGHIALQIKVSQRPHSKSLATEKHNMEGPILRPTCWAIYRLHLYSICTVIHSQSPQKS